MLTASKAPYSTAISKVPVKTQGKKASKASTNSEKKKHRTRRMEIYSSYIYKGMSIVFDL